MLKRSDSYPARGGGIAQLPATRQALDQIAADQHDRPDERVGRHYPDEYGYKSEGAA
jgi:hypothetical protein